MSAQNVGPALFDLADFEETAPPVKIPQMLPCGRHTVAEDDQHVADCWGHVCPSCGEHVANGFLYRINHHGAERGICTSVQLQLNHMTVALRLGTSPNPHDWRVLDLGFRFGPDGAQIHPDGHVVMARHYEEELRLLKRWAA
jgi:hypothetical protein